VQIQALVLAAGQGRRFGSNKLQTLYRGRPLGAHALDVVARACQDGVLNGASVVVGSEDEFTRQLSLRAGLRPVLNPAPERGLSHSLQLGLAALKMLGPDQAEAALVFLGDQPLVRLNVIQQMIAMVGEQPAAVLRPRYSAQSRVPGHPVLLARSVWPLVGELEGDRGFSGLLAGAGVETKILDVPGDNPDIDTPADLVALEESVG